MCCDNICLLSNERGSPSEWWKMRCLWILDNEEPSSAPCQCHRKLLQPERKGWIVYLGEKATGSTFPILLMSKQNQMCKRFIGETLGSDKAERKQESMDHHAGLNLWTKRGVERIVQGEPEQFWASLQQPDRDPQSKHCLGSLSLLCPHQRPRGAKDGMKATLTYFTAAVLKGNLSNTSPQPPQWF